MNAVDSCQLVPPDRPIKFNITELNKVIKNISNKKSYGMDGIPQLILRDSYSIISGPGDRGGRAV